MDMKGVVVSDWQRGCNKTQCVREYDPPSLSYGTSTVFTHTFFELPTFGVNSAGLQPLISNVLHNQQTCAVTPIFFILRKAAPAMRFLVHPSQQRLNRGPQY